MKKTALTIFFFERNVFRAWPSNLHQSRLLVFALSMINLYLALDRNVFRAALNNFCQSGFLIFALSMVNLDLSWDTGCKRLVASFSLFDSHFGRSADLMVVVCTPAGFGFIRRLYSL